MSSGIGTGRLDPERNPDLLREIIEPLLRYAHRLRDASRLDLSELLLAICMMAAYEHAKLQVQWIIEANEWRTF